jgi:NAD-dependent SIR2 family protein deacetylase
VRSELNQQAVTKIVRQASGCANQSQVCITCQVVPQHTALAHLCDSHHNRTLYTHNILNCPPSNCPQTCWSPWRVAP